MERIGVLVGIGLMLVGSCAYALPDRQDIYTLLPAFAGIFIAVAGVVALHAGSKMQRFAFVNMVAAVMLLVFIGFRIRPDTLKTRDPIACVADLDVLALALFFLVMAIRWLLASKMPQALSKPSAPNGP